MCRFEPPAQATEVRTSRGIAWRGANALPAALAAFFDVTLARIAEPTVPRGCRIAQTVIASPSLPPQTAAQAAGLLGRQRTRLTAALVNDKINDAPAEDIALQLVAVNQSLAVFSRAGISDEQLQAVARTAVAGQLGLT